MQTIEFREYRESKVGASLPAAEYPSFLASSTLGVASVSPDDLRSGYVVQDRYRICGTIGRGGMGVVYEAQHLLIGRKVALKTMAAHAAFSPLAIERFRREAQAAASVGSSHIVDVLDMGQLENGAFFMVLEHLDGADLAFSVGVGGPLPVPRALHVACQLCDALSTVHGAGIVHRDLKPENVFLIARDGDSEFVKVLDFGVCKLLGAPGSSLTASGDLVGTPQFMTPEQVDGGESDHRTDIHALGAILFYMLTGRPPYEAPTLPKLFVRISQQVPPSLRELRRDLPTQLEAVVHRALEKDPARRFQSCQALKAALLASVGSMSERDATLVDQAIPVHQSAWSESSAAVARGLRSLRSRSLRTLGAIAATSVGLAATLAAYALSRSPIDVTVSSGDATAASTATAAVSVVAPPAMRAPPEVAPAVAILGNQDPPRRSSSEAPGRPRRTGAPAIASNSGEPAVVASAVPPAVDVPPETAFQPRHRAKPGSLLNRDLKHGL